LNENKDRYVGSTDHLYYWSDEYGWLHYTDEKIPKVYFQWLDDQGINSRGFGMTGFGEMYWLKFLSQFRNNKE